MNILEIRNLHKSFGGHKVLGGMNMDVPEHSMNDDAIYKTVSAMLLIDTPEPCNPYNAQVINLTQRELYRLDDVTRQAVLARICGSARMASRAKKRFYEDLGIPLLNPSIL